jgi:hypothetical protein
MLQEFLYTSFLTFSNQWCVKIICDHTVHVRQFFGDRTFEECLSKHPINTYTNNHATRILVHFKTYIQQSVVCVNNL